MLTTKLSVCLSVAIAIAAGSLVRTCVADEGQGTAKPGSTLSQLQPGKVIYGVAPDPDAFVGQVVVVNIGGG